MSAYSAIDISNYIIESNRVNNLHLQKLLYYLQNIYMVTHNKDKLFYEDMEKWKLGPVVPEVYHAFKSNGISSIKAPHKEYIFKFEDGKLTTEDEQEDLPIEIKDFIDSNVSMLLKYDKFELVEFTHTHPEWEIYSEEILNGVKHLKYDCEKLYEYFTENPNELLVNYEY
ncbi:Panacea domain-containing protein [Macrococcus capreoli]|uniref:Panacea domain-containing protein n=1 Tax=Macrococcus capreoli TaxID=2982690 RepID=UPI003F41BB9E